MVNYGNESFQKVNAKAKFLYRQKYLSPRLKRSLCNALIQPHFDYGCASSCTSQFHLLHKKLNHNFQTAQNKCTSLSLGVFLGK